jgi:hypothetical protein
MLEIHLTGKTTEKRKNFDLSTPPACSEILHFTIKGETLNRETWAATRPCAQTAWEDVEDKVS